MICRFQRSTSHFRSAAPLSLSQMAAGQPCLFVCLLLCLISCIGVGVRVVTRASEAGHENIVMLLIAKFHASGLPCQRAPYATPLHAACQNGHKTVVMVRLSVLYGTLAIDSLHCADKGNAARLSLAERFLTPSSCDRVSLSEHQC